MKLLGITAEAKPSHLVTVKIQIQLHPSMAGSFKKPLKKIIIIGHTLGKMQTLN